MHAPGHILCYELRELERGDRRAVADVFGGLGEGSRRRRFLGAKPRLSDRELAELTEVVPGEREAVVAFEGGRAIGVARFVRVEADAAEVAFAVVDDRQGHGVGRELVAALAERARRAGIRRLRASVLSGNEAALALLRRAGRVEASRLEGGVVETTIRL